MDAIENVQTRTRPVYLKTSSGMRRHIRREKAKIRREVFDQREVLKRFRMLYESFAASPREIALRAAMPRKGVARLGGVASSAQAVDKVTNGGIKNDSSKSKTAGK